MNHAHDYADLCISDSNVLITAAYMKVLKEGESQHKAHCSSVDRSVPYHSSSLANA